MNYKLPKRCTALVSCYDFAEEAWLYMEKNQLTQVEVLEGDAVIGTLLKQQLDGLSRAERLRLDVKDFIYH